MKCLRRMEDTYFPCDKSSNPDKEERISVENLSNTRKLLKSLEAKRVKPRHWAGRIREPSEPSYIKYKESVEVMQREVTRLHDRLQRASQEAKEKLQQEKPAAGGSRVSHK